MLRFRSLGSGSTGNATLIEGSSQGSPPRRLLMDCGFGIRQIATRLGRADLGYGDVDGIFITHEHSDHVGCVQAFAVRHRVPVWMSQGTYDAIGAPDFDGMLRLAHDGEAIDFFGAFAIKPFTVPHDAREPLHLVCDDGAVRLGLLTDLGHATDYVLAQLAGCQALLLESNHDSEMLANGPYPHFLKRRVGGAYGHLSNAASAGLARAVQHPGLRRVVAAHLSERNNQPALAQAALASALGWTQEQVDVACPKLGTDWFTV